MLKPDEWAPLPAALLAEIAIAAGVPDGVLNIVHGSLHRKAPGAQARDALIAHPSVARLWFDGDADTGRQIMLDAVTHRKRLSAELAGNAPCLIFADADLDRAIDGALFGAFALNGSRRTATSTILAQRPVYDTVVSRLAERAERIRVGDPSDPETELGPLPDGGHVDALAGCVRLGVREGARLAAGGRRPAGLPDGNYFAATVLADVEPSMRIFGESICGPALRVTPFDTDEEAVSLANAVTDVAAAYLWTSDLERARRLAPAIESAGLWVNSHNPEDELTADGGRRQAGLGVARRARRHRLLYAVAGPCASRPTTRPCRDSASERARLTANANAKKGTLVENTTENADRTAAGACRWRWRSPPAAAAAAPSSSADAKVANAGGAIVVGTTLSLTGSLGAVGRALEAGYEQEFANVNAAGGIVVGGTREKLKLVVLDNGSNPSTAAAQAADLVRTDHAVALLGSATPLIVMPTALVAEQLRVPLVTSQMPVEAFASGDKTGWTYSWDLFYDERQQATDAARALAAAPGDKKVALFTDDEPDSVVERPLYEAAFKAAGLDVVGDYTFPVGTTGFSSFVSEARAAGAQLVAGQLAPADGGALCEAADGVRVPPEGGLAGRDGGRPTTSRRRSAPSPRTRCRPATGAPARHRLDNSPSSARRWAGNTPAARTTPRPRSATRWPRC